MFRQSILASSLATALAGQEPQHVPVTAFDVPAGLEVSVWATSPMLLNPTCIDIDARGRVWVAEGVNYRSKSERREGGDRIVVLSDEDGDGSADTSRVFVQERHLLSPLGIAVFDNRVVVSQPPDLIVYTDVDRDLAFDPAVDRREVLLTGFHGRNHDHSLHSVTAGPDGLWYWNSGNCGAVFTDRSGKTFRIGSAYRDEQGIAGQPSDDGHVWIGGFTVRMQPDGSRCEVVGHNYRNSYEQAVTSFGDVFQNDNDDPPACRVTHVLEYGNAGFCSRDGERAWQADRRPGQTVAAAEWRQDDPGTMPAGDVYGGGSPTGIVYYENGALGDAWQGLLLSCEPGRNTVFGYRPRASGAGFALDRTDWLTTNRERKFVGSDFTGGRWDGQLHTQFRPSDIAVGPDGAIYVADWFDGRVGGHQTLDDSLSGAIYRIAPEGFRPQVPEFDPTTVEGLVRALCSPAVNVRQIGLQGLLAKGDAALPAVEELCRDGNPYLAARGIWVLARLCERGRERTVELLRHEDPQVRLVAFRALRRVGDRTVEHAQQLAEDPAPQVRREVATAMRDAEPEPGLPILVALAAGFDGRDRTYLDALGIGATGKESALYRALVEGAGPAERWSPQLDWLAWRLGAPEAVPAFVARARCDELDAETRQRALTGLAFVRHADAAAAMVTLAADQAFGLRDLAVWWCLNRMGNEWRPFGVAAALKERGIYDPDKVVIQPVATPPTPPTPLPFSVADVLALQGDARRGEQLAGLCLLCHRLGDRGAEFGPDLTLFATQQSRQAVVQAILHPSESISHGYEGHTVLTDAGNIDGIVLSHGDPVLVRSAGGLLQAIPRSRVQKVERMKQSLMWPPTMIGQDAQGFADIVEYLASEKVR